MLLNSALQYDNNCLVWDFCLKLNLTSKDIQVMSRYSQYFSNSRLLSIAIGITQRFGTCALERPNHTLRQYLTENVLHDKKQSSHPDVDTSATITALKV